jgi:hypothetical protein
MQPFDPSSLFIVAGLLAVGVGLWWRFAPEGLPRFPLGNLPGDIRIQREGFNFFMPITSCLVVSAAVWLLQMLLGSFQR